MQDLMKKMILHVYQTFCQFISYAKNLYNFNLKLELTELYVLEL